jgi:hypothetical protein
VLDKESRQLINKAKVLGNGREGIYLEDHELVRLCCVAAIDLGLDDLVNNIINPEEVSDGYYSVGLEWFERPCTGDFEQVFDSLRQAERDFPTYLKSLCELHKRRKKFEHILQSQPIPQMVQVVPRSLLEYGLRPEDALASWLVWRKWLYDVDNRSAQETGYVFEPILAAAIGGVSLSARKSPIRRSDGSGKGRQVDCLDDKRAYEFKMRVTIAASGQGRFGEELSFAQDCATSGYTPVLLVLDPTPSEKLEDLSREYLKHGGEVYVGDDAWQHIRDKAGRTMGTFVERYVEKPIREVSKSHTVLKPIRLVSTDTLIRVQIDDEEFHIQRRGEEVPEVVEDGEDEYDEE